MDIKKYVLAKNEIDVYGMSYRKRSLVIKVMGDNLLYNNFTFELQGKEIKEWIEENPEKLKHNQESDGKSGSEEVFSLKNGFSLFEVKLDEDEDFFITIAKSESNFFEKDYVVFNQIFEDLKLLFEFIEPIDENFGVYSLKIRELIIKAATEVENHWKELMNLNGYSTKRFNTNDYCKLLEFINFNQPLFLESYPTEKIFRPFENWNCQEPTKSLEWYSVYNAIKHDRSNTLAKATLYQAINAVGAVYILATIRYGAILTDKKIELKIFKKKKLVKFSKWSIQKYTNFVPTKHIRYFTQ